MTDGTVGGLDVAYAERGRDLVACDAARRTAVETLEAERALVDRWLGAEPAPRAPWWPFRSMLRPRGGGR